MSSPSPTWSRSSDTTRQPPTTQPPGCPGITTKLWPRSSPPQPDCGVAVGAPPRSGRADNPALCATPRLRTRPGRTQSLDKQTALADETIKALLTACCTVAPSGKQNSFGSHARASFLLAEKGSQQPRSLSVAFLRSVEGPDILGSAIGALAETRAAMDEVYGKCADVVATFDAHGVKGEGSLQAVLKKLGLEQANNA